MEDANIQGEEAGYSNNQYYYLLSKLINGCTEANLEGNYNRAYQILWEFYKKFPFVGNGTESDERKKMDKHFKKAKELLIEAEKCAKRDFEKGYVENVSEARKILDDIERELFQIMKDKNMLVRVQEKGLALYG